MPEAEVRDLLQSIGHNVEAVGRMLKRKPRLNIEDLTELQLALRYAASSIGHIKSTMKLEDL